VPDTASISTRYLQNLWDEGEAAKLANQPLELLRYRSNLLGADLRITNFGGGNTSSKFALPDPLTGEAVRVLAVKGSGGDLRSIGTAGFAVLYLDKLEQLIARYRGEAHEDEMVAFYPLCAFGENRVAASIDTPLHAFLPFDHVDHLHPDWAIALAASANGRRKLDELNARYGRRIVWVPWQRPGFELGMMLRRAVAEHPGCDGILLGSHGLFTWGATQHECYANSLKTIDQMGEFVEEHARAANGHCSAGRPVTAAVDRESTTAAILPMLRGAVSSNRRVVAHVDSSDDAVTFANSRWAAELVSAGHELSRSLPADAHLSDVRAVAARTRRRHDTAATDRRADRWLSRRIRGVLQVLRRGRLAGAARLEPVGGRHSGARRLRLRQRQARGANHDGVLRERRPRDGWRDGARGRRQRRSRASAGAHGGAGQGVQELPQLRRVAEARSLSHRVLGARGSQAAADAARARIQPEDRAGRRRRQRDRPRGPRCCWRRRGAHVVVADRNEALAGSTWAEAQKLSSPELGMAAPVDLSSRGSIAAALRRTILAFGGVDIVINTAAIYPTPDPSQSDAEATWANTLHVNVTG
jgi:rhamnose utilization protein RhaD (predicted bifunctional aldolase and dehydrogenase)